MKNFESYVRNLGRNTHIRIDSDILESLNNGRFSASQILRDQFSNYNYILNKVKRVNVDHIDIVGKDDERRAIFNANRYLSKIFEYYGLEFERSNNFLQNARMVNDVIYQVENATCVQDFFDVSNRVGYAFVSSVLTYIHNGPYNNKKARYYAANFHNHVNHGEPLEDEVVDVVEYAIRKFVPRELDRLDQLLIDVYGNFKNLDGVPNSFVSNIKEVDFSLLVSFIILSDADLCYRRDMEKFVTDFIEKEGYKAIQDYKINFVYDNKDVEISIQDVIDKYISVYKKEVKIETPEVKEDEMPALDKNYVKNVLVHDREVVQVASEIFQEVTQESVEERVARCIKNAKKSGDKSGLKVLNTKITLWETINPKKVLMGTKHFGGYLGAVLENGFIYLDKFFMDENEELINTGEAWYIIHERDFEQFLGLTKMQSVRAFKNGEILGYRGYHTKGWDDLVLDIATMEFIQDNNLYESVGHKK